MNDLDDFRILIDGDSCPVKSIICKVGKHYGVKVILFCSYYHLSNAEEDIEVIVVDPSPQAVDMAIINHMKEYDIIVTGDYGLASLVLSKNGFGIHPNGKIYTKNNIDILLHDRYIASKLRRSGNKLKGPQKRSEDDNKVFEQRLIKLIENNR